MANDGHPDALDWPLMMRHVQTLRRGDPIDMPVIGIEGLLAL